MNNETDSQEFVKALASKGPDDLIELWTYQQAGAVELLRRRGWIRGDPTFAFCSQYTKLGKRPAYEWLVQQMRRAEQAGQLEGYNGDLPIWAWFAPPGDDFETRSGDQVLRIRIAKRRALIGFHHPWEALLHRMCDLEVRGASWFFPTEQQGFIAAFEKEERRALASAPFSEDQCKRSWERMFDLELGRRDGFLWGHTLQAVVPAVRIEDVRAGLE